MPNVILNLIKEVIGSKQELVTQSQPNVIKTALTSLEEKIHVAMPARIESYDYKTQKAVVKPLFRRKFRDGKEVSLPVIHNVPVACPRAGKAFIHMPLKRGDKVLLIFADRSLDKWLSTGGDIEPADARMHDLSDAVAYPGLYPFNDTANVTNGDDIVIRNGNTIMHIKANNHLQVINGTTELIKTMCDFIRAVREAWTPTCGGPQRLRHHRFAELERRFKSFLER